MCAQPQMRFIVTLICSFTVFGIANAQPSRLFEIVPFDSSLTVFEKTCEFPGDIELLDTLLFLTPDFETKQTFDLNNGRTVEAACSSCGDVLTVVENGGPTESNINYLIIPKTFTDTIYQRSPEPPYPRFMVITTHYEYVN